MADVTTEPGDPAPRGPWRAFLKLGALVVLVLGGIVLARATPVGEYFTREGVARVIEAVRGNPAAPVFFILTYGVAMALALPGSVLTLAGGALFGFWWGLLFNTLGANLGANAAFGVARWLGRDGVERMAGDRLEKFDRATRNHGFRGLFMLRLVPLVPFNALNFGSGLTSIRWTTYAAATAIGIFPGTVVYTFFADALLQGSQEASREAFLRLAIAGALLILLSFVPTIMKKLDLKTTGGTVGILLFIGMAIAFAGAPQAGAAQRAPDLPDHEAFTEVLAEHVRGGLVDYAALKAERRGLDRYLSHLATTDRDALSEGSVDERLAFWINAYNACMLKLVVDHYPLNEVAGGERPSLFQRVRNFFTDRPENSVWQIPDVFTRRHCPVAGSDRSQDEIEHEIIRPLEEPRIHFAVNCAAISCPVLSAEAYTAPRLDAQLDRQVRRFMADERHFELEPGDPPVLALNQVLEWYAEDFGGTDGVREFFVEYGTADQRRLLGDPRTRVEFVEYDWTLNDVPR